MMNAKLTRLLAATCYTALAACSILLLPGRANAQLTSSPQSLANKLSGVWQSDRCEAVPRPNADTLYLKRTFSFLKDKWAIQVVTHSDPACQNRQLEIDIAGRYVLEDVWEAIPGATTAQFTHELIAMTPHSPQMVQVLSGAGCADGNWTVNEPQDVSQSGCLFIPSVSQCPAEYDVIRLDEERLFFGSRSSEGLCSPENRPTQLESEGVVRVSS